MSAHVERPTTFSLEISVERETSKFHNSIGAEVLTTARENVYRIGQTAMHMAKISKVPLVIVSIHPEIALQFSFWIYPKPTF